MESFEQLVVQYEKMIYKIIHSLHIYKNKEEFFQTGLIALWEASQRFNPEKGSFSSYAYSYIKGRIQNELTKERRQEERNVYPDNEFWEMIEDHYGMQSIEVTFLLSHCEGLTDNQRKWVLYTCLEGLSVKEIAEKEGVSFSAVKAWRKGAKAKLRDNLVIID